MYLFLRYSLPNDMEIRLCNLHFFGLHSFWIRRDVESALSNNCMNDKMIFISRAIRAGEMVSFGILLETWTLNTNNQGRLPDRSLATFPVDLHLKTEIYSFDYFFRMMQHSSCVMLWGMSTMIEGRQWPWFQLCNHLWVHGVWLLDNGYLEGH